MLCDTYVYDDNLISHIPGQAYGKLMWSYDDWYVVVILRVVDDYKSNAGILLVVDKSSVDLFWLSQGSLVGRALFMTNRGRWFEFTS